MSPKDIAGKVSSGFTRIKEGPLAPVFDVLGGFAQHRGMPNSAYMAFYLILSLFPFLLAMVAIVSFINWDFSALLTELSFFPEQVENFIISYVLNIQLNSGWLLVYSIVMALWSSSKAVTSIQDSLDRVFSNPKRSFVKNKLFAMLYNLVFILLIVAAFSLPAVLNLVRLVIESFFGQSDFLRTLFTYLRWVLTPLMLPALLSLLYMRLPSQKMRFRQVWPGVLFTTATWILLSNLFPILVGTSRNALYGALNTFILMALFFQFLGQMLIYGAEIIRVYNNRGAEKSVSSGS